MLWPGSYVQHRNMQWAMQHKSSTKEMTHDRDGFVMEHYNVITLLLTCLRWPATELLVQQVVQANKTKIWKLCMIGALAGIPIANKCEKVFHITTSWCYEQAYGRGTSIIWGFEGYHSWLLRLACVLNANSGYWKDSFHSMEHVDNTLLRFTNLVSKTPKMNDMHTLCLRSWVDLFLLKINSIHWPWNIHA